MNDTNYQFFKNSCKRQGLLLDTNILLLYLVGQQNADDIKNHKRINIYTDYEYHILIDLIQDAKPTRILITSYVLSELSNLLPIDNGRNNNLSPYYNTAYQHLNTMHESHYPMKNILANDRTILPLLGFADTSIYNIAKRGCAIITDDNKLYGELQKAGRYQCLTMSKIQALKVRKII